MLKQYHPFCRHRRALNFRISSSQLLNARYVDSDASFDSHVLHVVVAGHTGHRVLQGNPSGAQCDESELPSDLLDELHHETRHSGGGGPSIGGDVAKGA